MDSSASHHLTLDLDNLAIHFEYSGPEEVTIGNGKTLALSIIGSSIVHHKSASLKLCDILHVHTMFHNVLAVHSLIKGNNVSIEFFAN